MITRSSIAFEDFLGSSIAPQVMPPWSGYIFVTSKLVIPILSNAHTECNKRSRASVRRLFVQFFPQRKFLLSIALLPSAEEIVGGSRGNSQKFSETRFNFYQFAPICGKKTSARVVLRPKHSWQMNRYKRVVIDFLNPLSFPE